MLTLAAPHRGLTCLAYSPDGRLLVGGGNGPGVTVWTLAAGRRRVMPHDPAAFRPVLGLAFDPADGWLTAAAAAGLARFDPATDPPAVRPGLAVHAYLLSPDGRRAVAQRYLPDARAFDSVVYAVGPCGDWQTVGPVSRPDGTGTVCGLLADGRVLNDHRDGLQLLPAGTADPFPAGVTCRRLVVAADGRAAVLGHRAAGVWRPGRGWAASVAAGSFADAAFHPDGHTLLTAGHDGQARVWDTDPLTERAAYDFGLGRLRACAVAPDGLTAAVASATRVVVFDLD